MLRQHHNARQVVVLRRMLLFGEVAQNVAAMTVRLCHHVEEKRLDIKVERFILQKQFRHEAEVLAVHFVPFPVHFKHGELVLSVDFVSWRMLPRADTLEGGA